MLQAQRYAALRKPYLINDMMAQSHLLNRKLVYQTLQVPYFIVQHSFKPDCMLSLQLLSSFVIEASSILEVTGRVAAPDCPLWLSLTSNLI